MLYALEDYIIDRYHPIVVDISKYFIPDENYNPDTTPVHFEESYNVLQSRIIQRILLNGEKGYFDVLPSFIISDLLRRPVSDKDFCNIYSQRELPFNSGTVLDFIFQMQELEEIAANRRWIASVYQKYNEVSTNGNSGISAVEAVLADSSLWEKAGSEESPFISSVLQYLHKVDGCLQMPPSELYRLFELDFEREDVPEWMFKLNLLSVTSPNYRDAPSYLSQFYQTVGDSGSLCKLSVEQYFYNLTQ